MSFYQTPAETGQRLSAAVLDFLFFLVVLSPLGFVHGELRRVTEGVYSETFCAMLAGWGLMLVIFIGLQIGGLSWRGQTLGMRIVKIRVVRRNGRSAGFLRAVFLREMVFGLVVLLPVAGQIFLLGHWVSLFVPHWVPWRDWLSATTLEQTWD